MKDLTDIQLQLYWERGFEDRVKSGRSKGHIKLKTIKLCCKVLDEAQRRGIRLQTPEKYQ